MISLARLSYRLYEKGRYERIHHNVGGLLAMGLLR